MFTMMFFYIGGQWLFLKQRIYFYYAVYILCWILYFGIRFFYFDNDTNIKYDNFMRVLPPMISYCCYFVFFIDYAASFNLSPKVKKFLHLNIKFLLIYVALEYFICFYTSVFIHELVHIVVRILIICSSLYIIATVIKIKNSLANYYVIGTSFLLLGGVMSMAITIFPNNFSNVFPKSIINFPLYFLLLGLIGEIIFYSIGLAYRQRTIESEKLIAEQELVQQKINTELQLQKARYDTLEQERNRLASELHDDVGSGISSIRLLAEHSVNNESIKELQQNMNSINATSIAINQSMREVIWSMSNNNMRFDELITYLKSYLYEYLDNNYIDIDFNIQKPVPAFTIDSTYKRNVFLIFKELAHNALKYSGSKKHRFTLSYTANEIQLSYADFGVGIEENSKNKFGNGLKNLEARSQAIGAMLTIDKENGLTINLYLELTKVS